MSLQTSSKLDLIINDLKIVNQQISEKSVRWKVGSILLLVGVPVSLLIFQITVLIGAISPEYTVTQLVLNYSQPKVTAMFATNYIHNPSSFEHLTGNYGGYCLLLYVSFILFFLVIPILKLHNILHFNYPDSAFFGTAIIFLFGLPFAISGISILFGRMLLQTGGMGFSGIVWAFYGYLFFLILLIFYDYILFKIIDARKETTSNCSESNTFDLDTNLTNVSTISSKVHTIIFISFLIIIIPIYTIFLDIGNKKIGVFTHFAGFTLGLFIASLMMMICEEKRKTSQIAVSFILLLIIAISSILWHFLGS